MSYLINTTPDIPWNDLPNLPLDLSLFRDIDIFEKLAEAKGELGRLQGRSVVLQDQPELLKAITLQECRASAAIDGIKIMDAALYKQSSKGLDFAKGPAVHIMRTQKALWWGHEAFISGRPISMSYFIELFRELTQSEDSIRSAMINPSIQNERAGALANEIIYTPPSGKIVILKKLENLAEFIQHSQIDPLLKMVISHFQFEAIHPFEHSNGILGRLLNVLVLQHAGQLDIPVLYLSQFINKHRIEYNARLAQIPQTGQWKPWFLFMLEALAQTARLTFDKINAIAELREQQIAQVQKRANQIRRPEELVHALFEQPYVKVKHLTDKGLYAENTARQYLNQLTNIGLLLKKQLEGHHFYVNKKLQKIIE